MRATPWQWPIEINFSYCYLNAEAVSRIIPGISGGRLKVSASIVSIPFTLPDDESLEPIVYLDCDKQTRAVFDAMPMQSREDGKARLLARQLAILGRVLLEEARIYIRITTHEQAAEIASRKRATAESSE